MKIKHGDKGICGSWTKRKPCCDVFVFQINKIFVVLSYKKADASTGCLAGMSTPPLNFLFLKARVSLKLRPSSLAAESVSVVSLDVVRSMVSSHKRVLTECGAFLSWETFPPLICCCQMPESLVSLSLCLIVSELLLLGLSRVLVLMTASRRPLCSGEAESLRAGEQEAVLMTGLVPGGSDKEERMQSSIGNNLGSTIESKHGWRC